jgi:hypothetical protein
MTGGTNTPKAVSSPVPTPARISAALAASNSSTPNGVRPAATLRGGQFGDWDEDKEPGIQARDLLLVLETDGKAPRSLMKGYNVPESRDWIIVVIFDEIHGPAFKHWRGVEWWSILVYDTNFQMRPFACEAGRGGSRLFHGIAIRLIILLA